MTRPDVKPIPKPEREPVGEMVLAEAPELERQEPGVKTVKRWTTDLIEHNQLRNKPRLFDQITEQARKQKTFAKDFAPLENYSSFEWTRNQSLRQQAEAQLGACAEEQAGPGAVRRPREGCGQHGELRPALKPHDEEPRGARGAGVPAALRHDVLRARPAAHGVGGARADVRPADAGAHCFAFALWHGAWLRDDVRRRHAPQPQRERPEPRRHRLLGPYGRLQPPGHEGHRCPPGDARR